MISFPVNPYGGPFSIFKKNFPDVPEWKWWHGQMRGWAHFWRDHKLVAALVGKPADEMAETYISLAKNYRTTFLELRKSSAGTVSMQISGARGGLAMGCSTKEGGR
jgi:hypothetical protein